MAPYWWVFDLLQFLCCTRYWLLVHINEVSKSASKAQLTYVALHRDPTAQKQMSYVTASTDRSSQLSSGALLLCQLSMLICLEAVIFECLQIWYYYYFISHNEYLLFTLAESTISLQFLYKLQSSLGCIEENVGFFSEQCRNNSIALKAPQNQHAYYTLLPIIVYAEKFLFD